MAPNERRYDVIVVGGGPAGLAAAYTTAKKGLRTLLLERGDRPGTKNLFGGIVHACWTNELLPEFWRRAPVERRVVRHKFSLLAGESAISFSFDNKDRGAAGLLSFTAARPSFDRWFAEEVRSAGALIVPETAVDDLLVERGRVVGVVAGRASGEVRGDVTIVADGALSLLSRRRGLRGPLDPGDFSLGAKEVLSLPASAIEERFGLEGDEGLAHFYLGDPTRGIPGGAFIYTNREEISIGIVAKLTHLIRAGLKIYEMLDDFKNSSRVKELIRGARPKEYGAKLIPEAGPQNGGKLYSDGLLAAGDAGGFLLSNGINIRGFDLAVASGLAAGRTAIAACEKGDFSAKRLGLYEAELAKTPPAADYAAYRRAAALTGNLNLYKHYPALACEVFGSLLSAEPKSKTKLTGVLGNAMRGKLSWGRLIKDVAQLFRAV